MTARFVPSDNNPSSKKISTKEKASSPGVLKSLTKVKSSDLPKKSTTVVMSMVRERLSRERKQETQPS